MRREKKLNKVKIGNIAIDYQADNFQKDIIFDLKINGNMFYEFSQKTLNNFHTGILY